VATMSDADFQVQAQTKGVKPTGLAFDTPSLKGLFATAPYLHDGSAPNLDAVLKLSDQGKMGATKDLTDVQRGQLKAYLMSL
jgi:cytochrome c peroxidase